MTFSSSVMRWPKCCVEIFFDRNTRFKELMSSEDTDALKGEFPRSVSMWEWLIEKSPDEKMTAIEKCRKSLKLWTFCLTDLKPEDDEDLEEFCNDALDAVGLVHDSLNFINLILLIVVVIYFF